jgi:sulfite exporter TauE/SafE
MSSIESVYLLMFMTGLLGGFGHCIGMCGPVVASYSMVMREKRYHAHLLYSLGRITTYSIIGGVIGLTGSFVGVAGQMAKIQNAFVAILGCVMIAMGLATAGWMRLPGRAGLSGNCLTSLIMKSMKVISEARGTGIYFPMGLVLGFIPCGLLYTVLIAAAGAGAAAENAVQGFLSGMSMVFLFGLGTIPALFLLGSITSSATERLRGKLYRASGILMVLSGIIFIYRSVR